MAHVLRPYVLLMVLLEVLMLLSTLGTLLAPYLLKVVIDDVLPQGDLSKLWSVATLLGGTLALGPIASFAAKVLHRHIADGVASDLRLRLFRRILALPVGARNPYAPGQLVHQLSSEVIVAQSVLTSGSVRATHSLLVILFIGIMLATLSRGLLLLWAVCLPLIWISIAYFHRKIVALSIERQEVQISLLTFLKNTVSRLKVVQAYAADRSFITNLSEDLSSLRSVNLRDSVAVSGMHSTIILLTSMASLAVFVGGGYQIIQQTLSVGSLVAFLGYLGRLVTPGRDLATVNGEVGRASAPISRINDILDRPCGFGTDKVRFEQSLTLENICLLAGDERIIADLNLNLRKGVHYAVVGASGAGKTSLLEVATGLREPNSGSVRMDSTVVGDSNILDFRAKFAVVAQSDWLMEGSAMDNLLCECHERRSSLPEVASLAGLPNPSASNFWQRRVGTLSAGEVQRLLLARALIKRAEILVLDEATSQLGRQAEEILMCELRRVWAGKTMIVVSHRLEVVRHLDEILVMRAGRVLESGSHDALVRANGEYSKNLDLS